MNSSKLKKRQASGWKAGDAQRFLELSDEDEEALRVEINLSLADALKRARTKRHLSQTELTQRMGSSQ